jgi:murein DD-endopeptidase MepM/ murein hydrolase activator NlpD
MAIVALAVLSLGAVSLWRPRHVPADPLNAPTLSAMYAAPVERVETHVLSRGETLSNVLSRAAITGQEMADLLLGLREHLNPRRLTEGVEVTVRRWSQDNSPRSIDVRVDADTTIRLVRQSFGWRGEIIETPVIVDTVYVAGIIEKGGTLYEALVLDEESVLLPEERIQLVDNLAEVYEFKLDFTSEIQPGDTYRLVYEREVRPDRTTRNRQILVSELVNKGKSYPAVWFAYDKDITGYYDPEGKPLKSGFSRYPVEYRRITSRYNPNRYHPVLGVYRAHLGTDFGAPAGSPVRATANGTVTFAATSGGYGRLVRIQHGNGIETRYAHLSRYGSGVRAGVRVRQGQVIGYVGSSGLATAAHLHYEFRVNGVARNAMNVKMSDAPPLTKAPLESFLALSTQRRQLLNEVTDRYLAMKSGSAAKIADH